MKVLAVYHNKGGVGKTTTVINLAAALSKKNKRVLVIDLDSQANTTFATGLVKFQDEIHDNLKDNYIYQVIASRKDYSISEVARKSEFTNPPFYVVPSHIDLMEHEQELIQQPQALTRLLKKLDDVRQQYDIVLIDTPPSLNLYARIALITADYLLIPSDLRPFANEGLRNVRRFVNDVNEFRDSIKKDPIEILGVIASKVGTSPKFVEYTLPRMIETVEKHYGFPVLDSKIFERRETSKAIERLAEVGDLLIPDPISILDYEPNSLAAEEFKDLAKEVMQLARI
ncbi:MAG: AAA family ATPase [Brasilonema octagenarum HA4186-MV1]|jgi:cellulose biosynthesis protein BcsQ|nr:AAA family ATPase [Brasilonema octagenarum HA4186-MV1]